jgi:two-component system OmpR family response regulator/two-component system response regulator QseB
MRLIVAEDDQLLGKAVQKSLVREGFAVDWVANGGDFFEATSSHCYDAVLLDLRLPDMTGEVLLERFLARGLHTPIIVMSSRSRTHDRVSLLDMGADDYLVKPFDLDELTARIRSVLRRMPKIKSDAPSNTYGDMTLYATRCTVRLKGHEITLTHREFWLLELLVRKSGQILSRSDMEDALYGWGEEVESNAVEVYIHHLRRKLGPGLIHTIRGAGYQLAPIQ